MYVEAHAENLVWKLHKSMYGLKDAGSSCDRKVEDVMTKLEYRTGVVTACIYVLGDTVVWRHGDSIIVAGEATLLDKAHAELARLVRQVPRSYGVWTGRGQAYLLAQTPQRRWLVRVASRV